MPVRLAARSWRDIRQSMGRSEKSHSDPRQSGVVPVTKVSIERRLDGTWLVRCEDLLRAIWAPDCLGWAAYTALHFARVMGLREPELGQDVPSNALELGRQLEQRLAIVSTKP